MRIENINLSDEVFFDALKKYLTESQPYNGYSKGSKYYIKKKVKDFIKTDLEDCDFATCFISEKEEPLFFLFCKKSDHNKKLEIKFPFPNLHFLDYNSWSTWPFTFCHLMLDQLNKSGMDESFGTIERTNKQSNYEKALDRFGHKMFEIKQYEGARFKEVSIKRKNLEKAHKLLIRRYKKG